MFALFALFASSIIVTNIHLLKLPCSIVLFRHFVSLVSSHHIPRIAKTSRTRIDHTGSSKFISTKQATTSNPRPTSTGNQHGANTCNQRTSTLPCSLQICHIPTSSSRRNHSGNVGIKHLCLCRTTSNTLHPEPQERKRRATCRSLQAA